MAEYSIRDSVAIIQLDNAPVNALSVAVRTGLYDGIERAAGDGSVKAVVVCGKGGNFCAGADIKEFDEGSKGPWITEIGDFMDRMRKPVVAAIEGVALGGGLEVALFCHYRIAAKNARVGQPEVNIGLIPGGGGTVRLPRAAGFKQALEMIVTGNPVRAERALKMGVLDEVVSGNILEAGIKFALSKAHIDTSLACLRNRPVRMDGLNIDTKADAALAHVKSKYKGFEAPMFCVKAVVNAARVPYDDAIQKEREYFFELRTSGQSQALRYAFFAERQIARWGLPGGGDYRTARAIPVRSVGVVGAGTMGAGIALCIITSGLPCVLLEQNQEFLEKGVTSLRGQLMGTVRLGKMTAGEAEVCLSRLKPSTSMEDLKHVDMVIEAVFEDLKLKREVFERLDKTCKPETILCTNTSTLDIDSVATATGRPDKVVGTHFFAPSYLMKLLENIYGSRTSPETVATVMRFGKTIRKVPVLVGSCTGFVANRMLAPYTAEAQFCVEEGASPAQVDSVLMDFGMPMGTFRVSDLSGIDVSFSIRREAARKLGVTLTVDSRYFRGQRHCSLIERLVEKGRLGRKTGKGWYKYEGPGGTVPLEDPDVLEIIETHCRALGIERRNVGSHEIQERMQLAMINEGFKILEEGICTRAEEIDVIWLYGFGWPRYLGGPMFYASKLGLKRVFEKICTFHKRFPHSQHWVPSVLLGKLSESGLPLSKWGEAAGTSRL
ncbi:peroxisomal bifunctional enzyme-like [Dreissena polymorpha]|uniref:Peroxisomal bifunctional enzyme n=1 Tax=Dreissena polymorpha TaxID=45954 RepID=A0A9D4FCQ3_DREPO|nr:peroxisomal bifunctional enzyme-like [Dreissena polymorpha]KAH3795882.1 hypothetical protein DPMN_149444 [Dreissena polymorpha]